MRRRLRKFLPIVLIALMVQIFAPIGAMLGGQHRRFRSPACGVPICHGGGRLDTRPRTDQTGQHRAHDGCLLGVLRGCMPARSLGHAADPGRRRPIGTPCGWSGTTQRRNCSGSRTGAHAQARAPPSIS